MDKNRRKFMVFLGIIIIALLISGIRLYLEDAGFYAPANCTIEYGNGECIGGYFKIPFYNPNQQDITRIIITVPYGIRTNITLPADFKVSEPLHPDDTGVLTLFACDEDADMSGFLIEWCCGGECSRSGMRWPSREIKSAGE